jgi:hypothetical protein
MGAIGLGVDATFRAKLTAAGTLVIDLDDSTLDLQGLAVD